MSFFSHRPCYKNMEHAVLDRFLRPLAECLTPEVAQRIVDIELDPHSQARLDELAAKANDQRIVDIELDPHSQSRLDELAAKANEGHLTDDERREYEEFVEGIGLMGILKARARTVLVKHPL